jgi:6,7-dimethyl-8-ribityllumazine synthase
MATKGNTELNKGIPQITDAFVVIVKTEWNAHLIDELEAGCKRVLEENGVACETYVVPGAFEIPFAIKAIHSKANKVADAFVALGAVIKGDTPHFDYVCNGVTNGIQQLNVTLNVPVVYGILTVNNEEQALERIGGAHGHKGEEAAVTAIKMIALNKNLSQNKGRLGFVQH